MKRKRLKDLGPIRSFALATGISLASFIAISFLSSIISAFFENSRFGAECLTLPTLILAGFISGFVSRKILREPLFAMLSPLTISIIFALLASIVSGYSLGAFMNEVTFFLLSAVGIFAARERRARRRR